MSRCTNPFGVRLSVDVPNKVVINSLLTFSLCAISKISSIAEAPIYDPKILAQEALWWHRYPAYEHSSWSKHKKPLPWKPDFFALAYTAISMQTFIAWTCIWTFIVAASSCGTTVTKTVQTFVNILTNLTITRKSRIAGAFETSQSVNALCVRVTPVSPILTLNNIVAQASITQEACSTWTVKGTNSVFALSKSTGVMDIRVTLIYILMSHFSRILQERDNEKNQFWQTWLSL